MNAKTSAALIVVSALISSDHSSHAAQILMSAPFNGHTYHMVGGSGAAGTGINYTDASAYATQLGGFLVTVNDAAENLFLYDTFANAQLAGFQPVDGLYLGFNDVAVEGTFVWDSGSTSLYTNWAAGEPNNTHGREDWASMVGKRAAGASNYGLSTWNDIPNIASTGEVGANPSAPFYGIVEIVPEPASITLVVCSALILLTQRTVRLNSYVKTY